MMRVKINNFNFNFNQCHQSMSTINVTNQCQHLSSHPLRQKTIKVKHVRYPAGIAQWIAHRLGEQEVHNLNPGKGRFHSNNKKINLSALLSNKSHNFSSLSFVLRCVLCCIFQPLFGVRSTQTLVEIYNSAPSLITLVLRERERGMYLSHSTPSPSQ